VLLSERGAIHLRRNRSGRLHLGYRSLGYGFLGCLGCLLAFILGCSGGRVLRKFSDTVGRASAVILASEEGKNASTKQDEAGDKFRSSSTTKVQAKESYVHNPLIGIPDYSTLQKPKQLVSKFRKAGFRMENWQASKVSGWYSMGNKQYCKTGISENEVSVLLESTQSKTVERVEIEAEFYRPGMCVKEVLAQFKRGVRAAYPKADKKLLGAIDHQESWTGIGWSLHREPFADNTGYSLVFSNRYPLSNP